MDESDITDEALTLTYRKIREARETMHAQYKTADNALQEQLKAITQEMLKRMGDNTGFKNQHGSVSKVIKTKYWSTDWDSFRQFAVQHDAVALIENRISQKNMAAWLDKHPDKVPPGLQTDRRYDVLVVKPRNKPE